MLHSRVLSPFMVSSSPMMRPTRQLRLTETSMPQVESRLTGKEAARQLAAVSTAL